MGSDIAVLSNYTQILRINQFGGLAEQITSNFEIKGVHGSLLVSLVPRLLVGREPGCEATC